MKLRYTSLQIDTGAAEEHLDDLPAGLDGAAWSPAPCTARSPWWWPLPFGATPSALAYVMTDGAAFRWPSVTWWPSSSEGGLFAGTITAGHAFGGDHEAVGVPSALALARHDAGADVIVVGMGPGVVGAGHRLGTTALEQRRCSTPPWRSGVGRCLRPGVSGDERPRHRGLSHHTATVLDLVRSSVDVPVPSRLVPELAPWSARHRIIDVPDVDVAALLAAEGLEVTTMGRGPDEDALFFDTAAARGSPWPERRAERCPSPSSSA